MACFAAPVVLDGTAEPRSPTTVSGVNVHVQFLHLFQNSGGPTCCASLEH
jgi:hypothetical protein